MSIGTIVIMNECQSCSLPLGVDDNGPKDNFGTMEDGSKSEEYCEYCFQDGKFTEPDLNVEQMIDKVTGFFVDELDMPVQIAKELAETKIPRLNRWNKTKN
jgi:hypothetical protein